VLTYSGRKGTCSTSTVDPHNRAPSKPLTFPYEQLLLRLSFQGAVCKLFLKVLIVKCIYIRVDVTGVILRLRKFDTCLGPLAYLRLEHLRHFDTLDISFLFTRYLVGVNALPRPRTTYLGSYSRT
jgi:hypothetical protein